MSGRWRRLKKPARRAGGDPGGSAGRHRDRAVVARRGPDRAEEQDHPALGAARHAALSAARPAHRLGLHLRGDLPGQGQGRWSRPALLRHRGHGGPVAGDQPSRGARRARGAAAGPGRLACLAQAPRAGQHHAPALPPRSPELNPVENVWQFVRDNWLSNRVFGSYEEIVDHAVRLGTSSSTSPGSSCPSACATGPMGSDQRTLV